ncbi:hypothetical protein ACKWTF_016852 [Chironomus riparius]
MSIGCKLYLVLEILTIILQDFICADISLSSLGKNSYNSYTDLHPKWGLVSNVTTQIGTHAYLPCKVKQIINKSVSWVRVRDDHILTVDRMTFIADERFQSFYVENTGLWTLQIKYVQARDAGMYECQVSTEPKVSARVHLHVVVPRTELIGDPDRYVKAGSTVVLHCVVRGALEPPSYIIWYHDAHQLLGENQQKWKIKLDRGQPDSDGDIPNVVGSLIIHNVNKRDSGNYSCSPSNSYPLQITLNVINGMVHKILCSLYIFSFSTIARKEIIQKRKAGIYFLASLRLKSCVPQHNFWSQKGNKLMTKFIIHFFSLSSYNFFFFFSVFFTIQMSLQYQQ